MTKTEFKTCVIGLIVSSMLLGFLIGLMIQHYFNIIKF